MSDNPRIDDLRRRLDRDPASIAFAQLGEEYRRIGRFRDAIDTCRAGLERHPAYLSARVTLGRALLGRGAVDEAEKEMRAVLRSAPENLAALRALGEIGQRRGDVKAALLQYEMAFAHAPQDPELEHTVTELRRQVALQAAHAQPAAAQVAAAQADPPAAAVPAPVTESSAPPLQGAVASPKPTRILGREFGVLPLLERWLEAIVADRQARALGQGGT